MNALALPSSPYAALRYPALLAIVIAAWGINWSANKVLLQDIPPLWITVLRSVPACALVWLWALERRALVIPTRADIPVLFAVGVLHMVAFSALSSFGLQSLPAGRSVVLAYTTPLWVLPLAHVFLGERLHGRRLLGLFAGVGGLAILLRPSAIAWHDPDVLRGHALILLAALCWALCIVCVRRWRGPAAPWQMLPWQLLLATALQGLLALIFEGPLQVTFTAEIAGLLAYGSLIGNVLAYWAMNTVNRHLPASVVSLSLLGVPVFGLAFACVVLGEPWDASLGWGTLMILGGIAVGLERRVP